MNEDKEKSNKNIPPEIDILPSSWIEESFSSCEWSVDDDRIWTSGCGEEWAFIEEDSTPQENGMNFCMFCGKKLTTEIN